MESSALGPYSYPETYRIADEFLVHCWYPPVGRTTSQSQTFIVKHSDVAEVMCWARDECGADHFEVFVRHKGEWVALYQRIPDNITSDTPFAEG